MARRSVAEVSEASGTTDIASQWLRCIRAGSAAERTLACFPHAGGSAAYYGPLLDSLPADIEAVGLQYPGRHDRCLEPVIRAIDGLADAAAVALSVLGNRALALFGHSMGALVAFEVAVHLQRAGRPVRHLFVSGHPEPSYRRPDPHRLGRDGILEEVRRLGGMDILLEDPRLLKIFLPALEGDFAAVTSYRYRHRAGPLLTCPVTALVGDTDPVVSPAGAHGWARVTTGRFGVRVFPGGHFYLTSQGGALTETVSRW